MFRTDTWVTHASEEVVPAIADAFSKGNYRFQRKNIWPGFTKRGGGRDAVRASKTIP